MSKITDELIEEFSKFLNHLRISSLNDNSIKITVPNGSESCTVSFTNPIYLVKSSSFSSTYLDVESAALEVLMCLVTRELLSNGFTVDEVNYVTKKMYNGKVS
jgi:hypothetical protein